MKTKKQVIEHLENAGYSPRWFDRIMGFLIGKGLKDDDEIIAIKIGNNTFADFILWYEIDLATITSDDIEYGDYVHVCEGHDVIAITLLENEPTKFVGCDGLEVGCYILSDESRLCTDEELAKVQDKLHDNGLDFDYASCSLVPLSDNFSKDA